ncbi:MAG: hypothetical protein JRJ54_07865, partial [Deltaproteobacteria bacterium]|nr:hypothetical protein [Deltaproteobacteria bacterium]
MTRNGKKGWILCGIMLFVLGGSFPAVALQTAVDSDPWTFSIAPYLWMAGIDGDITVQDRRASVDAGFDDVWSDLDFGGQIHVEVGKGRWGAFIDPTYSELTVEENTAAGRIEAETSIWLLEFGGYYRAVGFFENQRIATEFYLVVLGGGRFWD